MKKESAGLFRLSAHNDERKYASTLAEAEGVPSPRGRARERVNCRKRVAFTLAEVLITLGVIGIVAAITLPNLIQRVQEKVLLHQFDTAVSIFSQGFQRMSNDADGLTNILSQYNDVRHLNMNFYSKYFKMEKFCGWNHVSDCIPYTRYTLDKKTPIGNGALSCGNYTHAGVLNNGMNFCVYGPENYGDGKHLYLVIDINGKNKPNAYGYDIFVFKIQMNGVLKANLAAFNFCNKKIDPTTYNGKYNGMGCAINVMKNHNFSYLH